MDCTHGLLEKFSVNSPATFRIVAKELNPLPSGCFPRNLTNDQRRNTQKEQAIPVSLHLHLLQQPAGDRPRQHAVSMGRGRQQVSGFFWRDWDPLARRLQPASNLQAQTSS